MRPSTPSTAATVSSKPCTSAAIWVTSEDTEASNSLRSSSSDTRAITSSSPRSTGSGRSGGRPPRASSAALMTSCMAATSSGASKSFVRNRSAPVCAPQYRSEAASRDVSSTTGMSEVCQSSLSSRAAT